MSGKTYDGARAPQGPSGIITVALALMFGLGTGGASCDDQVDRLDADRGELPEVGVDMRDMDDGDPDAGDMRVDMADAVVDAIVDADLRTCDAGMVGEPCSVGRGACFAEGVERCTGEGRYACDAIEGRSAPETCNGVDDDCDGTTDEGDLPQPCYTGPDGTEGVGECKSGMWACPTGPDATDVCEGQTVPGEEACNGRDDDCDGVIDEDAGMVPCYGGPEGTAGVGLCRAGETPCPTGPDAAPERCDGEVLPTAEVCDGTDSDCDGAIDVGEDPAAPGARVAVCGELVADYCRAWLGWTDDDLAIGDDLEYTFVEWADCPIGMGADDLDGSSRCVSSGLARDLRTLPLPAGQLMDNHDIIAMMWQCRAPGLAEPEFSALLRRIQGGCRITFGEQWQTDGPDVQDDWTPCPMPGDEQVTGIDGFSRCTTTFTDGAGTPRFRALNFTARFGEQTDLGIAFHCPGDDPMLRSVQQQSAVWLGWAARPETPDLWLPCNGVDPVEDPGLRCVSTAGDGRFHRLRVNALLPDDAADFDPGLFGIGLRPRPVEAIIEEQAP